MKFKLLLIGGISTGLILAVCLFTVWLTPSTVISKEYSNSVYLKNTNLTAGIDPLPEANFLNIVTIDPKDNLVSNESLGDAGLLCDWTSKKIVWSKKMFEPHAIASVTKMMVALITLEDIRAHKFDWDTHVAITPQASNLGGSSVYLRRGEVLTVRDLLKAAMIASGNDACYQLAQFNGSSEWAFVSRMNARAKELGMRTTHFSNSTGLPHPKGNDNISSPVDLLLLANELLKYPEILSITKIKNESIKHGRKTFHYHNHNRLVMEYEEVVDGFKTGYTRKAGFCIVATAEKKGHRLISVVLGSSHSVLRNKMVSEMFNNYYSSIGMGPMQY